MDNFDLRKYLAEGKLLKETFVKLSDEQKKKVKDAAKRGEAPEDVIDSDFGGDDKYLQSVEALMDKLAEGRMKDPSRSIKMGKYPQVSSDTPVPMNVKYLTTNGEKLTMKVQAKNRKEAVDAVKSKDPNFKAEIKTDFVYDKDGNKLLKETKEEDYYNLLMDLKGTELDWVTERRFEDMMLKRGNYNSFEDFLDDEIDFFQEEGNVEIVNKIKSTFLNENKLLKEYLDLEIDEDQVTINSYSGEYSGFIEDDGTVDFSVTGYEEEREDGEIDFDEDNWKDILGPKHAFVKISNQIPTTKVEAAGDYVMITVDLEDLKAIAD